MWIQRFLFVAGVLCMYQVFSQATEEIYVAEVMVESNVTLTSTSILASWSSGINLTVNGANVKISSSELVAECLVVGEDYSCNCSANYAWSNEVCYSYGCCTEATCTQNVSQATSICVPKTLVQINGSVHATPWGDSEETKLRNELEMLNGVGNITISSSSDPVGADFEVNVSVRLNTSKLHEILDALQKNFGGPIYVDTKGMVLINAPNDIVRYQSTHSLKCTLEEATDSAGWNLSRPSERFSINNGLQAKIYSNCATEDYKSCVEVHLLSVTGAWAGMYECGFTTGTVRHTASAELKVALLPDSISMTFKPLIVDCSKPTVTVNATIPSTTENYTRFWSYNDVNISSENKITSSTFSINIKLHCEKEMQRVSITFVNSVKQTKSRHVEIPVLHENAEKICKEEYLNNEEWPKTPAGVTVFNQTCPPGRTGYRSRTCDETAKWQEVFSNCISEELSKVTNAAKNFLNGLGATQEVAKDIFAGIKNSSSISSDSGSDDVADISASIGIMEVMGKASENIILNEDVFPDLVDAASNMVNSNWSGVNDSIRHGMSSNYLTNVESLVKNIKINTSDGFNSSNLELKFCSSDNCSMSVFGIDVNMNMYNGTLKTMGVKNLMEKLRNNEFPNKNRSSILLSATLVGNDDSNITIKMIFPDEQPNATERLCVFWDTDKKDWSDKGCVANLTDDNQTLCECKHLTSFSVLMSRGDNEADEPLDLSIITYIGLGVSIFSLLVFLFVESLVWSAVTKTNLSHFRHTAVVNIGVFRLLADCSFLASDDPSILSDTWCFTLTVCKHLFYLAMFCWMLCLSVMLVHQLIFVFSPVRKRVFMYLSSIVGYVLPIALVATSYVYYRYTEQDYYDSKTCWLIYVRLLEGSVHAFLIPVGVIVLSNLFSMVVVIVTLVKTSVPDSSKADDKETAKSILKVVVFLTPVFGVTWIFGFALYMLEDDKSPMYKVALYLFVILNSFQGLFILLTGCLGEQKVRQEVIRIIMVKTGRDTGSIKKLTNSSTTLYTKDK